MSDAMMTETTVTETTMTETTVTETTEPNAYAILFHGNCIDGWFSAFIAMTRLQSNDQGERIFPSIDTYPVCPSQQNTWPTPAEVAGRHIYLLDVSLPVDRRMAYTEAGAKSIMCLDHHETSKAHWTPEECPIHTECCAAILTFRHFFPADDIPAWLLSIDRVDRWDHPTEEDRCLREKLAIIAHLPIKKDVTEAMRLSSEFLELVNDPVAYEAYLAEGRALLAKKDNELKAILMAHGTFHVFTDEYLRGWNLPESWRDAHVFIMNNSHVVIDSTEAAHLLFTHYPTTTVFINYRIKTFYTKEAKPVKKQMVVYSARSRGFPLTEGTIFKGHPTSAGASLVVGEAPAFPFLLAPLCA